MTTTQTLLHQEDRRRRLSSLMDGELDSAAAHQLLADLARDPACQADWALWHVAGDALRASEVAAFHSASFYVRMSAALANEPTIVAPRFATPNPHRTVRRIVLPGVAAAAAVAALGWLAIPMTLDGDEPSQQASVASATQVAAGNPLTAVPQPQALAAAGGGPLSAEAVQAVRFDRYMAAHAQVSGTPGLPRTSQYLLRDPVAIDREGR